MAGPAPRVSLRNAAQRGSTPCALALVMAAGSMLLPAPAAATYEGFLKSPLLQGDSLDDAHKGEIELISYTQNAGNKACFKAIVIKNLDRASAALALFAVTERITPVTVTLRNTGLNTQSEPLVVITFRGQDPQSPDSLCRRTKPSSTARHQDRVCAGLGYCVVERGMLVARQRDHAHARMVAPEPGDRGHSVEPRHVQVDDHRVGRQLVRELDCGEAVESGADDRKLGLALDQRRERIQERRVVVGKENSDGACRIGLPHGSAS